MRPNAEMASSTMLLAPSRSDTEPLLGDGRAAERLDFRDHGIRRIAGSSAVDGIRRGRLTTTLAPTLGELDGVAAADAASGAGDCRYLALELAV